MMRFFRTFWLREQIREGLWDPLEPAVWVWLDYGKGQLLPSPEGCLRLGAERETQLWTTRSADVSSVWSQIIPDKTDMSATERSAGLATLTDASYAQTPYYNAGYTGYGMYGNTSTAYYQQLAASGVRAQSAAFPYNIGTAAQNYYGSGYPSSYNITDYAFNPQYYNNIRNGYGYGALTGTSAYTGTSLASDSSDLSFSMKDKKGKSSKKKKSGSCSPDGQTFARVFVWELSDISSLAYVLANKQSLPHFHRPVHLINSLTNSIVGLSFPADQIEDFDICNVEDAVHDDNLGDSSMVEARGGVEVTRRVANKYFNLRQLYQEVGCKNEPGTNYNLIERCQMNSQKGEIDEAYRQMEDFAPGRTAVARRCLDIVFQRSAISQTDKYANVIISTEKLPNAAAILLQVGLATSVPLENIYCAKQGNRDSVLEKITSRFGKKCSYIVISSDQETVHLAKKENIPVWPIPSMAMGTNTSTECLEKFFSAQTNYLLGAP